MKQEKPFEMSNASYIPNQLFDNRLKFLTGQQRIFLIYLYRRLWGYGETEIKLSYSVVFEDFPCIIKNKQKFSNMISDLAKKGIINIVRGKKKCHTYIINEENYKNLIYWGERANNKDYSDIQNDIDTGIHKNKIIDIDLSNINLDDNSLETMIKVYQYEYKRFFPKSKKILVDMAEFSILKNILDTIPDIHYSTFIRCYFLNDFYNEKPTIDRIYDYGIEKYNKYKDIVKSTRLDENKIKWLLIDLYDGSIILNNKSMKDYMDKNRSYMWDNVNRNPSIFYSSKYFIENYTIKNIDKQNEIYEEIKKFPVVIDYVNNILKDDSIFMEV